MSRGTQEQPDVHPVDEPVEQDGVPLVKWERKIRPDGAAIVEPKSDDKTEEKPAKRGRGRPRKNPDAKPVSKKKPETKKPKNAIVKTKKVVPEPDPEPDFDESEDEEIVDSEEEVEDEDVPDLERLVNSVTEGVTLISGLSDAPAQRKAEPTIGAVHVLDDEEVPDLSDGKPKTLEDLFAKFPVGDTQHFIRVNRRKPQSWHGYTCHGLQRPIRQAMSYEEFVAEYGGGEYALTVIGPPRKGGVYDPSTGKVRPKTLTGEIVFTVPWDSAGYGGYAPNPESALIDIENEEEEGEMRFAGAPAARGPATPATAAMFKTQVEAEERREERLERRERERSAAEVAAVSPAIESLREMGKSAIDVAQSQAELTRREAQEAMRRAHEKQEKLEERLREQEREAREREERLREEFQSKNQLDFGGLAALMASMRPKEDNTAVVAALESAKADVQRVQEAAQREMDRVLRAHTDERRLWDERVKEERDRADRRLREIEELADKRVAEAERRAERMIKEVREDADRQLRATETMYKIQLDNAAQNRDRDHQTTTTAFESRMLAEKAALEARISMLEMENKRQSADAEKWRQEAENNKDIVKKIQEFTGVAEALGFQKDAGGGGDDDDEEDKGFNIKAILSQALVQGITTLPSIISNAGEAAARLKGAQTSQMMAMPQSMSPAAMAAMPTVRVLPGGDLPFGSEESGPIGMPFDHSMAVPLPAPPPVPRVSRPVQQQPQYQQPSFATVQQQAPTQAIVPVQQQASPIPEAPQKSRTSKRHQKSQRASEQVQDTGDDMINDSQILMFRSALETAISNGESPEDVANGLKSQYGEMVVKMVAGSLSPSRVAKAVMSAPDGASSVLVQPVGQEWLEKLAKLLA